jgi:hypothetical protein
MIACSEAVRRMWEYVERQLPAVDRTGIEHHLDLCLRCCGELEFVEELRRFMRRSPVVAVPAETMHRLDALLESLVSMEGST